MGLFYPPDPASLESSSIGGNVAECAGGPRAFKYGTTKRYVLALEAVLPTGEIVRTGSKAVKNVVGYDLTQLLVGSEGTLAIITQVTLRLIPKPPVRATLSAAFPSAAQLDLALASRDRLRAKTPVIANARFFIAEDYHQKYYLRHDPTLLRELDGYTPAQFVDSTVAARLNAFAAGHGTLAALDGLGLSPEAEQYLRSRVGGRRVNCG